MSESTTPTRDAKHILLGRIALGLGIAADASLLATIGVWYRSHLFGPFPVWEILLSGLASLLAIILGYCAKPRFNWELGEPPRPDGPATAVFLGYGWWLIGSLCLADEPEALGPILVLLVVAFIELPRAVLSRRTSIPLKIVAVFFLALVSWLLYCIPEFPYPGIVGTVELAFLAAWILFQDIARHRVLLIISLYALTIATVIWGWYMFSNMIVP